MTLDWRADLEVWAAPRDQATTAEVLAHLGFSQQRHLAMRAARTLRELGFTRRIRQRRGGGLVWVYARPKDQVGARSHLAASAHPARDVPTVPTRSPPTTDPEWRSLRAQLGGKERALREVQQQRDTARARARELERELSAKRRLEVDPEVVALRADAGHGADCLVPSCARCLATTQRLEETRPRYATEAELVESLETAGLVFRAGATLLDALRAQGVGAASRRLTAQRAFAALLDGNLKGAETLLSALGG